MNHKTCLSALFIFCFATVVSADETRPNVLLILADDLGWADIGYNNPKVYSPNIDRLASKGVTFTQHYVMPQCTPTRVALMTGRYPGRFGGPALQASNDPAFPLGTPTLATMLQANGYRTALTGKWHLGSDPKHGPKHFGFESSYGSLTGAVGMYDHRYRPGAFEHTWHRNQELIEGSENGIHATDLVAAEAVRIIEQKAAKPFFLYVPFHSVHTPLDERGDFVDRPTQLDPADPKRWLNEDQIKWFNDPDGKIQQEIDPEKRLLLAAVYHMDHVVGEMVEALKRTGQRENTLILFSSDNGPQGSWSGNAYPSDLKLTDFNQPLPFRGKKLDVWEGGIHVPAFANWPNKLKAKEEHTPTHIIDWFPTLAKLTNSKQPSTKEGAASNLDGTDLGSLLFLDTPATPLTDRDLYWTWNQRTNRWALRHGDWKIVKYGVGAPKSVSEWQLYNLSDDPKEANDLAIQLPEKVAALHIRFVQQRSLDAKPVKL